MAGKRLTSKDLEDRIQELLKRKEEFEKYEKRFVIVEPLLERLNEILKNKNITLTEGESNYIIDPIRNVEKFVRDRFEKKSKKAS